MATGIAIGVGVGPFGSVAPWTPAALAPAFWLDPAFGITLNGSTVASWAAKYGSLTVANATGAQQPAYTASALNGRPGLTFAGAQALKVASATLTGADYSLAIVVSHTSIPAGGAYAWNNGTPAASGFGVGALNTRKRELVHSGVAAYDSTALLTLGTAELVIVQRTAGAAPTMRVNGAAQTLSSALTGYNAATGSTIVGAQSTALGLPMTGVVFDIVGGSRAWSAGETAKVESFFRARYALW